MPKLLLIYPRVVPRVWKLNIPTNLVALGSYLVDRGYSVRILDGCNASRRQLYAQIKAEIGNTLAVGISAMSAQISQAIEVARLVRQLNPSLPIIWGGVHPTLYPEQVAGSDLADFVVRGEGEATTLELLKQLESANLEPEGVKGIAYKTGNSSHRVVLTPSREFLNMDELPLMNWELLEGVTSAKGLKTIAQLAGGLWIMGSRGCPWRCTFCINSVLNQKYRVRSLDLVIEDIQQLVSQGINSLSFLDEDFFVNKGRAKEFLAKVKSKGIKFTWGANARANYFSESYLNPEFLAQLKDIGLVHVGIGAESGSERMLERLRKEITCEDIARAAKFLSLADISASFSFMMGVPGETEEDLWSTIRLIGQIMEKDSSHRFVSLGPKVWRPYPGSILFEECLKYGMKTPADLKGWGRSPYIGGNDFLHKDARDYPWVKMPIERMLTLGFYGALCGVNFRFQFLTTLFRRIALWRCRKPFLGFPIELKLYRGIVRSRISSFLLG